MLLVEGLKKDLQAAVLEYYELLTLVKKRKLRCFCVVSRSSGLTKTILQDTGKEKEKEADRRRGGKTLPAQLKAAEIWTRWRGVTANSSVVPR